MMGKKRSKYRWVCLSLINLFIHLMDGLVTYINTPDLEMEANILVSRFGYGWGALFTANLIGFLFIMLMAWDFCRYEHVRIPAKGRFDYYMKLFYGEDYKPYWCLYKFSRNWNSKLACLSYSVYWGLTIGAAIPVLGWILYMLDIEPSWWHSMLFSYIVAVTVAYAAYVKWICDGYETGRQQEPDGAKQTEKRGETNEKEESSEQL